MNNVRDLPFTERAENERCLQCRFASRERLHATDLMGALVCREGPKQVTSIPGQNGQVIGLGCWSQVAPSEWCYRWEPRHGNAGSDVGIISRQ